MSEPMNTQPLYQVYSQWLKEHYGEKVYKLPVNIPLTCPNRDDTVGQGGCIYCGAKGGGLETLSDTLSITKQLEKNRAYIEKRYKAHKFIPFFQSFSNTYMPIEKFKAAVRKACQQKDVVALSIATRPDCIFQEHLDFFKEVQADTGIDIVIELGLQTANDHTLKIINRGHDLADYSAAAHGVKSHGLQLCTHVILDLPWDDHQNVKTTAGILSAVASDFVKCHALYIERGTVLAQMYASGAVALLDQDEYIQRCILFLEHLDPMMVVQRIIGRAPAEDSVTTNWNTSWWKVRDALEDQMCSGGHYQGRLYGLRRQEIRRKIIH
ncbi:TIGR01212 family radical SAM protein [Eubacterium aggregans]|uniref:TIGR01212 family radical SAM protein n=1 Tax=Eubacterium aggregans TaxID=81409 RepID=UPI003F383A98